MNEQSFRYFLAEHSGERVYLSPRNIFSSLSIDRTTVVKTGSTPIVPHSLGAISEAEYERVRALVDAHNAGIVDS